MAALSWRRVGALLCSLGFTALAAGQGSRPGFYFAPVEAVVGVGTASGIPSSSATSGMINTRAMSQFVDDSIAEFLGKQFTTSLRGLYGAAVVGLNQVAEAGNEASPAYDAGECSSKPSFLVDFKKTFAVVLGVSRFSYYVNRYSLPGGSSNTQILIPVTYTLRFIELTSATTAYSKSLTIYTRFEGDTRETFEGSTNNLRDGVRTTLRRAISDDALKAIEVLVTDSKKEFSPVRPVATVLGSERGGYFFLDRGSEVGLTSGKQIEAKAGAEAVDLVVRYATTGLAVVTAFNKEGASLLKEGTSLELPFSGKGVDSAKPTVMAVPYRGQTLSDDQVRENALMALIAADLGRNAPFNVLVNDEEIKNIKDHLGRKFCDKNMLAKMPGFTTNSLNKQKGPDFYLRVDSTTSPVLVATGAGGVTSNQIFSTSVGLNLVDNLALVRQAALGSSPYELKVTAGKGLSMKEAGEINLKNAALKAAEGLTRQFRHDTKAVKVVSVSKDPAGALLVTRLAEGLSPAERKAVRFVRPLTTPKTRKVIYLPLDTEVGRSDPDAATVTVFGEVREGDLALVDAGAAQVKPLAFCDGTPQRRFQTAQLSSPSNAEILMGRTVSAALKGFRLAETDGNFIRSTRDALKENFFEDRLNPAERSELCLLPMELQSSPNLQCDASVCNGHSIVGSGVRVFDKGNKIAESLLSGRVEIKDLPAAALSAFVGLKMHEFHVKSANDHPSQLAKP